jgi:alpha-beta hydrolase superfamily lysophospholipase
MLTLIVLLALLLPFLIVGGGLALFWKRRRRAVLRGIAVGYCAAAVLALFGVGPYLLAWWLSNAATRPRDMRLQETPANFALRYEDIAFEALDGVRLSGWFVPPESKNTVLICTHGLFRNRNELLPRVTPLLREGYGAVFYDSRSHGSSDKATVSLGFHERNDVLGAMRYVRRRYQDSAEQPRIVLFGISMGASATLEAAAESKDYSAVMLDSPFLTVRQATIDHTWLLFKLPRYPFPDLFLFWLGRFAGFDPDRVDLMEAIARTQPVPLLIIASQGDERIGADAARALYNASRSPSKKLQVFGPEVTHAAAARMYPEAYGKLSKEFLTQVAEGAEEHRERAKE